MRTLRNGADVVYESGDVVLAYWEASSMPWVVWVRDAEDRGAVHSGKYYLRFVDALNTYKEATGGKKC